MKKLYPEESVQAIADAIRTKTGKTDKMTVGEMSGEIEGITTSVADAIEARFKAQGWTRAPDPIGIKKASALRMYAKDKQYFRDFSDMTGAFSNSRFESVSNLIIGSLPDGVEKIDGYCFNHCTNLALTSLPDSVASIGNNAFAYCTNLALTSLPDGITKIDTYAFYHCSNLALTSLPDSVASIGVYAFEHCYLLDKLRLSRALTSIGAYAFRYDNILCALTIPAKAIVTLANINAFTSTPIASGTGYIYVPSALVDSYKTATNWTTYASQFRALEDYTVDGTIDGELDESKI